MFTKIFSKEKMNIRGREATVVKTAGNYSLADTLECGQCFRHELTVKEDDYVEYIVPIGSILVRVGQEKRGELIFYEIDDGELDGVIATYFSLNTDYEVIKRDILSHNDSAWLARAAECAEGVAILKQDEWETLFSFIVSQNNNIPRIRKIIRRICAEYGVNITLQNGGTECPCGKISTTPCEEKCKECGICYTFPTSLDIIENPEGLLPSHPGFRYKYLCDAAEKVARGEVNLKDVAARGSFDYTLSELMKIKGVGLKVASCCALFGFGNLEAFPVDVWMKRAIDEYFDGRLDPSTLGKYAGVAQQYIFHYIRNIEGK